ncbi:unnamed protein product [Adineta ricciae]|uniref:C2H2-type domain-containing protein n=1 Tax=Adineta ricciae TaxID=249248 RepID=A0A815WZ08_ADIRI|nr:unnamed protein product [Adineta ricciae]
MNRMGVSDICNDDDMICPYHRYSLGLFWRPSILCQSPRHSGRKPKATHSLPVDYCQKLVEIEGFKGNKSYKLPIPTLDTEDLCSANRISKLQAQERLEEITIHIDSEPEANFGDISTNTVYPEDVPLHDINRLLNEISKNIKPLTYQVHQPLHDISNATLRKLKNHYESIVQEFSYFICEAMAPGQGNKLDPTMASLVEAYNAAPTNKWKYFLLSTVAKESTREKLQGTFNCSRYMIDKSRYIAHENKRFDTMNQSSIRRERLEKHRLDFFFDFLFSTGLIQDVAHGTTFVRFGRGDEILIPHVVRVMMKTHIFQLYRRHCALTNYEEPLSRSTVLRVLSACKMRQKKTLCGLDSFAVDGNAGFDTLERLLIKLSRTYLKFEYGQNVNQDDTDCATHCRLFAFSSSIEENLKRSCKHSRHYMSCIKCNSLLALICRIEELLTNIPSSNDKDELEVDFITAKNDILSWMFHIIRGVQQDKSKQFVISRLDSQSGLLLSDWAMKVLPQQHREKMDEWFGKKGISLHVDVLFYMDINRKLKKMTYFTAIDRCLQDMSSVLCVFEHVLDQIKTDLPNLKNLYTRSDNAGCYAGASIIIARKMVCDSADICLKRTDFSERQRGKDQADRDIAVAKSCLRAYTNRGGDLINATSIKEALDSSFGKLSNSKTSVIAVYESQCILPKIKIEGITKYHSVAFDGRMVRFWQYFGIGNGISKKIVNSSCTLRTSVIQPFCDDQHQNKEFCMRSTLSSEIFFCSNSTCSATFANEEDLMQHEEKGEHISANELSLSTIDRARYAYIEHLKGARLIEETSNTAAVQSFETSKIDNTDLKYKTEKFNQIFFTQGYAIRRRQITTKITQEHQHFFLELFRQGENTGKKVTVEDALQAMRCAVKADKSKLFTTKQYLSKNQIRSLFGRLSRKESIERRSRWTQKVQKDNLSISSDEDDAQHYFRIQRNQEFHDMKTDEINNAITSFDDIDDAEYNQ